MTNHSFFQCPFRNLDISEVVLLKRGDYLYFEKRQSASFLLDKENRKGEEEMKKDKTSMEQSLNEYKI